MSVDGAAAVPRLETLPEHPRSLFAGVEPLEVFVELLAELDTDTSSTEFYDRICEAICRLTTMRRAAIFMADAAAGVSARSAPTGPRSRSWRRCGRRWSTRRSRSGRCSRTRSSSSPSGSRRRCRPSTRELLGITTLVCTPLSAAGRAYGVICADRGGGRFELSDGERHLLWTLGKTAALVATARNATRQQERTRRLGERLDLAREIHERVHAAAVRGVARAERRAPLDHRPSASAAGSRCRRRSATCAARSSGRWRPLPPETGTTLSAELERAGGAPRRRRSAVAMAGRRHACRAELEPLAQSVLAEALRNIAKHAESDPGRGRRLARRRHVHARGPQRRRARRARRSAGMGLRLAAFEALQHGGVVEFGPTGRTAGGCGWSCR